MPAPDEKSLNTNPLESASPAGSDLKSDTQEGMPQPEAAVTAQPGSPGTDATPAVEGPKWPQVPCQDGQVYGAEDPSHPGHHIAVMSVATWLSFGNQTERYRRIAQEQDAQLRAAKADLAVMTSRASDAETRLNNLREVRRAEKRAELEPAQNGLVLPGQKDFTKRKPQ